MITLQGDMFHGEPTWRPPVELPNLHGTVGVDVETRDPGIKSDTGAGWFDGGEGEIIGFSLAWEEGSGYWPLRHAGGANIENPEMVLGWLREQARREDLEWAAHYSSYEHGWLGRDGVFFAGPVYDTWVAGVLLDETRRSYGLDTLAKEELGSRKDDRWLEAGARALGIKPKDIKNLLWKLPGNYVGDYGATDAVLSRRLLVEKFLPRIRDQGLEQAFQRETELTPVLVAARRRGIRIDIDQAERTRDKLQAQSANDKSRIQKLTGIYPDIWNVTSLEAVLKARGITVGRTDTGHASVTKEFLDANPDEVCGLIRHARAREKFVQFILAGLRYAVNGHVHPQVNQLIDRDDKGAQRGAISSRFSYQDPNMQQLPARDEEGKELVRGIYCPDEGQYWAAKDYSQQEPRLMVHFAAKVKLNGVEEFVERYNNDPATDFYNVTVELTGLERKPAKTIGLGIPYGMGGGKLCRSLGLPTRWLTKKNGRWEPSSEGSGFEFAGPEGQKILDLFDSRLPFVKKLADLAKAKAKERGWIRTLGGGLCRFPVRDTERMFVHKALNRLIQRSAADQTKQAMINVHKAGGDAGRVLVQVHDELGLSVAEPRQSARATEIMLEAMPLVVPSKVDTELGPSWGLATEAGHEAFMREE